MNKSFDSSRDIFFMEEALNEAQKAFANDEIPVGTVLVKDNVIIDREHNRTRELNNPLAHAEKLVLERNSEKYLYDYTIYVTLEPCLMCASVMIFKRLGRVVYAAFDEKTGAVGSVYNILQDKQLNHNPKVSFGIKAEESKILLQKFFADKRKNK